MAPPTSPRTQLPPRVLPVLYFGVAHASLALAFAAVAIDPRGIAGFFYHSRMLVVVHLVTLGWITTSILGSLYIAGPVALRVWLPARRADYVAFALVVIGIAGLVANFWLDESGGMGWSAATVGTGILVAASSVVRPLLAAPLPRAVVAHIVLAFLNVLAAAAAGMMIAFDKTYHFLPGFVINNVLAHAHLAAVGWASMMVVGVAYRLLPMVLPAAMPSGRSLWVSLALIQTGVSGLTVALFVQSQTTVVFAVMIVAGFGAFVWHGAWMLRRRRPRPPGLRLPDPALLHAAASFASLAVACALGVWLTAAARTPLTLRVAMVYGVFGLVGFLAQMVVGMEGRLLPMFAWYWAFANAGSKADVLSQHQMAWRTGQLAAFALWAVGVPALAVALALDAIALLRAAALLLLLAVILGTINVVRIVRHAFAVLPHH